MISEERLQELIDQKATIWAECYGEIQLCDESKICYDEFLKTVLYYLSGFMHGGKFVNDGIMPNFLEENVEKGKWCYEMHVSRIERFEPPVWKDVQYDIEKMRTISYKFYSIDDIYELYIDPFQEDLVITISGLHKGYGRWKFTKENYIKACTIARKLFLGEGIENDNKRI